MKNIRITTTILALILALVLTVALAPTAQAVP